MFTYSEILKITNLERFLGRGGSCKVYYGCVDNETEVAVKLFLEPSSPQAFQQFQAEAHTSILTWEGRLQVAIDAAQGLEYLHHDCMPPIIHRDVKSTNILLNKNFKAKISDFGVSRNFTANDGTHIKTGLAGTHGYHAPEYTEKKSYLFNEKTDVYSFGIVLLEVITGRPVFSKTTEAIHIKKWVDSKLPKEHIDSIVDPMLPQEGIESIVDPRLDETFNVNSVRKAVKMAIECVSTDPNKRPTMSKSVESGNSIEIVSKSLIAVQNHHSVGQNNGN
ncbi:putative leucine-rich repeat receptor-like serine/threonine-protein kinase [Prunus yedoensis var. nudiflora]|uniref:Putative leucine-rich repeat receptor-like serine/threonine-protein kinase n=1 Tax=Prunus yedoensis var. nudiflora TaxID=2094558 RepID=A0A314YT91_PRUYE|nr:putative leucine-rich repeat receptor-like serine/threonine-protein kinase [Prunus yedoensis var. nudiflora]